VRARDVEEGADLVDVVAFFADQPGTHVVQSQLGGGQGLGAEFVLEALDGDTVELGEGAGCTGGRGEGRVVAAHWGQEGAHAHGRVGFGEEVKSEMDHGPRGVFSSRSARGAGDESG
jgi:hypothetical protein